MVPCSASFYRNQHFLVFSKTQKGSLANGKGKSNFFFKWEGIFHLRLLYGPGLLQSGKEMKLSSKHSDGIYKFIKMCRV